MPRRLLTASALAVLMLTPALIRADDAPKGDKPKSDKDAIRGAWEVVSSTEAGAAVPAEQLRGFQFIFTADVLTMKPKDAVKPQDTTGINYTLDSAKDPKEIDTSHEIDPGKPIIQLASISTGASELTLAALFPKEIQRNVVMFRSVVQY